MLFNYKTSVLALAVAAISMAGCKDASLPVETSQPTLETSTELRSVAEPSFADISDLVASGNRPEALTLAKQLLADTSPTESNVLIDTYFERASDKKNNGIAIVLAETISDGDPKNSKAAYLAGLAYWNGITVEKNPERAVAYWDRPAFEKNKAVQSRLAELYGDTSSTIYDADKAELSRQRAAN